MAARSKRKPAPPPKPPERGDNFQYDVGAHLDWIASPPSDPEVHSQVERNVVNAILMVLDLAESEFEPIGFFNRHLRDIQHIDWFYPACPDTARRLFSAINSNRDQVRCSAATAFLPRP